MNYEEYYELFGPPAPLVKYPPAHAGPRRTPSTTSPCSTSNPSSHSNRPSPIPPSPPWKRRQHRHSAGRRWRRFPRSTAARISPKICSGRPEATPLAPSARAGTSSQSMTSQSRPNGCVSACAPRAITQSISFLTSWNAAHKCKLALTQRQKAAQTRGMTHSYLN